VLAVEDKGEGMTSRRISDTMVMAIVLPTYLLGMITAAWLKDGNYVKLRMWDSEFCINCWLIVGALMWALVAALAWYWRLRTGDNESTRGTPLGQTVAVLCFIAYVFGSFAGIAFTYWVPFPGLFICFLGLIVNILLSFRIVENG